MLIFSVFYPLTETLFSTAASMAQNREFSFARSLDGSSNSTTWVEKSATTKFSVKTQPEKWCVMYIDWVCCKNTSYKVKGTEGYLALVEHHDAVTTEHSVQSMCNG